MVRPTPALLLAACVLALGCGDDEPPEEVVEVAEQTCTIMPAEIDEAVGAFGHSVIIFEAYEDVQHLVSPEEFQEVLEQQCPETMQRLDEAAEAEADGAEEPEVPPEP
jgi:hypothetical protein